MSRFIRRYRIDSIGFKRRIYKIIDKITPDNFFRFEAISYDYKSNKYKAYFLNSDNKIWYNPVDPTISSHASFFEMYNDSILEAIYIIKSVNKYFYDGNLDLKTIFSNKSYVSGLNCDIKIEFKKFAF